jgi:hypothetical protein
MLDVVLARAVGTRSITTILLKFNTENMNYKNTPPPLPIQIRGDLAPLKKVHQPKRALSHCDNDVTARQENL